MTKINIQQKEDNLKLADAILFYQSNSKTLALAHKVNDQLQLSAGKPLDMKIMTELFHRNEYRQHLTFLPGNILAMSLTEIIWFQKSALLPIYFKTSDNKKLNRISGQTVYWPNLVFKTSGGALQVWAVKCSRRPVPNTPLYTPPLTNIRDYYVCMKAPERKIDNILENARELYQIFIKSAFTLHHPSEAIVHYEGGHDAFWVNYCRRNKRSKKPLPFPNDVLNPIGQTLKDIL